METSTRYPLYPNYVRTRSAHHTASDHNLSTSRLTDRDRCKEERFPCAHDIAADRREPVATKCAEVRAEGPPFASMPVCSPSSRRVSEPGCTAISASRMPSLARAKRAALHRNDFVRALTILGRAPTGTKRGDPSATPGCRPPGRVRRARPCVADVGAHASERLNAAGVTSAISSPKRSRWVPSRSKAQPR